MVLPMNKNNNDKESDCADRELSRTLPEVANGEYY